MFGRGMAVGDADIRKGMGRAFGTDEHIVAFGVVSRADGTFVDVHEAAVSVGTFVCANPFADNGAFRVLAEVDHFGSRIGLHFSVREGDGVKFAAGIVPLQNATRVFPGNGTARFDLRPADMGIFADAFPAFRHKVVNAAFARFPVACVPVLHGAVFDARPVEGDEFHDGGMQLIA